MKILTVVGARPQFVKAAVVSKALKNTGEVDEVIVHTGQHFDENMSAIFFDQMQIPKPQYMLEVSGLGHGAMTGRMLEQVEEVIVREQPDCLLVYGDTNSTLAGALAAAKLHIPVAHVEAGLRSFNNKMPEEINRVLTDNVSQVLFCPTNAAVDNLMREGFAERETVVKQVGDVMQDAAFHYASLALKPAEIGAEKGFILATLHRAENTDDPQRLKEIVSALNELHVKHRVILPLHPRTRAVIKSLDIDLKVEVIDPVGYLEMLWLLESCSLVLTDSGGVQKEAFFFSKPCVTMRDQTEWVELLDLNVNILAGANREKIVTSVQQMWNVQVSDIDQIYGGGQASKAIADTLVGLFSK